MSLFYPIVFGATCAFACYSAVTIAIKKFIGYKKDKNLVKNITIMIDDKGEPILRINNAKHNNPIIGSIGAIIATTTWFAGFGLISFQNVVSGDGPIFQFWFIWFAEIFFKTILPLLVIICRESFRSFIRRFVEHLQSMDWNDMGKGYLSIQYLWTIYDVAFEFLHWWKYLFSKISLLYERETIQRISQNPEVYRNSIVIHEYRIHQ